MDPISNGTEPSGFPVMEEMISLHFESSFFLAMKSPRESALRSAGGKKAALYTDGTGVGVDVSDEVLDWWGPSEGTYRGATDS